MAGQEVEDVEMGGTTDLGPEDNTNTSSSVKPDPDEVQAQQQQQLPASSSSPPPQEAAGKMKAATTATKKRGTASSKKTTKKSRGGPKSKSKSSKSKSAASGKNTGGGADGDGEGEDGGEGGGSSDEETDNGPYCLCRGPDDHRWMISCDVCEDWFHGECVSLDKEIGEKLVERFVCPNCTDGKKNYTKYRKTCSLPGCRDPARLYNNSAKSAKDRSVFCSNEHCDAWWSSMIGTLPTKAASKKAIEVLTQEDFLGLLAATADKGGWRLGDKPFGESLASLLFEDYAIMHISFSITANLAQTHHNTRLYFHSSFTFSSHDRIISLRPPPQRPSFLHYRADETNPTHRTGNIEGLWSSGLPTRPGVLSEEEQAFLQTSAAERLALGNEIVQYKKMMQLLDWANSRRQAAIEAGKFTKDSCGYDWRLDTVSVRVQFAAWLDTPEGQAVFKAGKLDAPVSSTTSTTAAAATSGENTSINTNTDAQAAQDPAIRGTCDRKRCKPHSGWYKLLMSAVRVLVKETATAAAAKLEAEEAMRREAEARYERRQLENNWVEVLSED